MIVITPEIAIHEQEIGLEFTRSPGPGGQNVNKVATAVQLRFDVRNSPSLPDDVRQRLIGLSGKRLTADGILILHSHRFRSQEKNRQDALDRLVDLIRQAARQPKTRRRTAPAAAAKRRRLEKKRRRGEIKKLRRHPSRFED